MFGKNMALREDGRLVHDMYLMQVKKPAESKSPWDYYHVRSDDSRRPRRSSRWRSRAARW